MNIHRLTLGELDTNCYVVWEASGNALIIDPADDADAILQFVREQNLTVTTVVLTHVHFDHMLAAEAVCSATNAPLYVGAGDLDALSDPIRNLSGVFTPAVPVTIDYADTLREGDAVQVGEMTFSVMETPGHTPGCICLYSDNILFSGDTLFCGSIGRLDFPGGDALAMQRSLQRLICLPAETVVYSGHGPETTIGAECAHNPFLK